MDARTRGVLLNVNILRFVQHFTKCCSLLLNDEVMQYQMKSKSLSSVLYQIRSQMLAPLSIHFNLQCSGPSQRYTQKSAIKRDVTHNGKARLNTRVTALISMNIVRGLSSHCEQHKCLDFLSVPITRRNVVLLETSPLTISKSTNWGEK